MKQAKPIIHGRDHAPGGADPIPFTFGMAPAVTAWSLVMTRDVIVEPTVGGAGYDGSDWAAPAILHTAGLGFYGVQDTNAWNDDDPDNSSGPTSPFGDLYQAGIKIYSLHYPLTDWGFVSGDDVASVRISKAYQGTYRVRTRFAVTSDNANSQIVALATEGFQIQATAHYQQTTGANYLMSPTQVLDDPTGSYIQRFQSLAITDPGSTEWNLNVSVSAIMDGIFSTEPDGAADTDLIVRVFNPGPDDVTLDIAIYVEKLDTSFGLFSE